MTKFHAQDFTAHSAVITCLRSNCGWRCIADSKQSAWMLYADHARRVHDDHQRAAQARRNAGVPPYVL